MSQDHYFTADPASPAELREREVVLAGRHVTVVTAGGIFSPDGIDKGTAVLLRHAPEPPAEGTFLDLGCGWGPLALTMALHSPAATVHAVDVNQRALDLVRRNAASLGLQVTALTPEEALGQAPDGGDPTGEGDPRAEGNPPAEGDPTGEGEPRGEGERTAYDLIWSNPPIRVGKAVLHEMMRTWLPRLAPGGEAWLVVQKNLGADSLIRWLTAEFPDLTTDRPATSGGFRLIRVARDAAQPAAATTDH